MSRHGKAGGQLEPIVGRHTPGPWQVIEREQPHYLGTHEVRMIYTAWDHPQMQGPLPVVCVATGIGESQGDPAVQFCCISEANAALIAAAPELLDALQELRYACTDKAERMADAAIAKALGEPPNAALSCAGSQTSGNTES